MLLIEESPDRLDVVSPMPAGKRILLLFLSFVPLLAPYELIFRPLWEDYGSPFFLFAAAIAMGAVVVSGLLVFAAVAGRQSRMRFDRVRGTFRFSSVAPLVPERTHEYPAAFIEGIEVAVHDWSDGAPSYSLKVVTGDRREFSSGSSWSRDEVERVKQRVASFLGLAD